jgi:DNA modification methylase
MTLPLDQILTGDARELIGLIPDESIDLIFTDPVYSHIDDYEWIAKEAVRVLCPDSACLAWYGGPNLDTVISTMRQYLTWTWQLKYVVIAKGRKLIGYNLFVWTTPCLWFRKGKGFPHRRIPDTFVSTAAPTGSHKWNKNEGVIRKWMDAFTVEGDVVLDPFLGSGTTAVVAKQLNRRYIGFEIDERLAEVARDRVALAQPSLFTIPSEQLNLQL